MQAGHFWPRQAVAHADSQITPPTRINEPAARGPSPNTSPKHRPYRRPSGPATAPVACIDRRERLRTTWRTDLDGAGGADKHDRALTLPARPLLGGWGRIRVRMTQNAVLDFRLPRLYGVCRAATQRALEPRAGCRLAPAGIRGPRISSSTSAKVGDCATAVLDLDQLA